MRSEVLPKSHWNNYITDNYTNYTTYTTNTNYTNYTKMWDSLSSDQKNEKIAKIRSLSPVSRLLDAGCVIIPPRKNNQEFTRANEEKNQKKDIQEKLTFSG